MKKILLAMVATFAVTGLVVEASAKTLRYAEFGPNRGTRAEALNWFAEELKTRTNGALEIEFHWGKSLLGTKAVLQGLGDGVADMGSVIGFFTPKKLRAYNIGDLPVDNSNEWVGMRALYEMATTNPAMQAEFAKSGVHYISNYTTGPIQLICKTPVATLADLKGAKTRASGPYGKALGDLGAEVQRMAQSKVYQALDSGLVDCNQNYYYSIKAYKQYEVAGHVTELDWGQNMSFGIFMNEAAWNGLSDDEKKVMTQLGSDFIDHLAELMIKGKESNKSAMEAGIDGKKILVVRLSDDERAALIKAGKKYVQVWTEEASAEGLDGPALLAAYEADIAKFAAEKAENGYPWTQ